ncbi:MAG: hypothetical protein ABJA83_16080 [Burkholderiaceae bacterium]
MNILNRIVNRIKLSNRSGDDAPMLDYIPVEVRDDWRAGRLAQAAQRHGKPFKCASDALPREVLIGGKNRIAVESSNPGRSTL